MVKDKIKIELDLMLSKHIGRDNIEDVRCEIVQDIYALTSKYNLEYRVDVALDPNAHEL